MTSLGTRAEVAVSALTLSMEKAKKSTTDKEHEVPVLWHKDVHHDTGACITVTYLN